MEAFSKTIWVRLLLIAVLLVAAIFVYQSWQTWEETGAGVEPAVIITTDKTVYEQGESMKITVRNGLKKSIWYADFGVLSWWKLEKRENKEWKLIELLLPTSTKYGEECIAFSPPLSIEELLRELKSNSEINATWNLRHCKGSALAFIEPGNYRLTFTYGLSKDSWNEKTIYSKEFAIKGA